MSNPFPNNQESPYYIEKMPYRYLGTSFKKRSQIYALQWITRVGVLILISYIVYILLFEPISRDMIEWMVIGMIAVALMLFGSEFVSKKDLRASKRIHLYSDEIEMYITYLEKIMGKKNRIGADDIERIEILRYPVIESLETKQAIRWKDAPVEFVLYTKNKKKYRSGAKLPSEVVKITSMMNEMWGIPIIDNGQGMGYAIPLR